MSVWNDSAIAARVIGPSTSFEYRNPGSDGITTSTSSRSARGSISTKLLGHPWASSTGGRLASRRRCTKCWPRSRNCGYALSRASAARQSKSVAQYSTSERRYAGSVPASHPGALGVV